MLTERETLMQMGCTLGWLFGSDLYPTPTHPAYPTICQHLIQSCLFNTTTPSQ